MGLATEAYNTHLWMISVLQNPFSLAIPHIPFFHPPTWEMPLLNPLGQVTTSDPLIFSTFLFPQQVPETVYGQWASQMAALEAPPASSTIILTNDVEVPTTPHLSHVASSSQLLLRTRPPPTPEMIVPDIDTNLVTEEIEKALELMRETRTEIMILKDIKVILFK
uniref:Uncharacterized protein n=1 Tax=Solanum tuberosum TaxID=4113 RepID=M1DLA6_SOLTU